MTILAAVCADLAPLRVLWSVDSFSDTALLIHAAKLKSMVLEQLAHGEVYGINFITWNGNQQSFMPPHTKETAPPDLQHAVAVIATTVHYRQALLHAYRMHLLDRFANSIQPALARIEARTNGAKAIVSALHEEHSRVNGWLRALSAPRKSWIAFDLMQRSQVLSVLASPRMQSAAIDQVLSSTSADSHWPALAAVVVMHTWQAVTHARYGITLTVPPIPPTPPTPPGVLLKLREMGALDLVRSQILDAAEAHVRALATQAVHDCGTHAGARDTAAATVARNVFPRLVTAFSSHPSAVWSHVAGVPEPGDDTFLVRGTAGIVWRDLYDSLLHTAMTQVVEQRVAQVCTVAVHIADSGDTGLSAGIISDLRCLVGPTRSASKLTTTILQDLRESFLRPQDQTEAAVLSVSELVKIISAVIDMLRAVEPGDTSFHQLIDELRGELRNLKVAHAIVDLVFPGSPMHDPAPLASGPPVALESDKKRLMIPIVRDLPSVLAAPWQVPQVPSVLELRLHASKDTFALLVNVYDSFDEVLAAFQDRLAAALTDPAGIPVSVDSLLSAITALGHRLGSRYVVHLSGMVMDYENSRQLDVALSRSQIAVSDVRIVSHTLWPQPEDSQTKLSLPPVLLKPLEAFTHQFEATHPGRTLTWRPNTGLVTLEIDFDNGETRRVRCSPSMAAALSYFAQDDDDTGRPRPRSWTTAQLGTALELPSRSVRLLVRSWATLGAVVPAADQPGHYVRAMAPPDSWPAPPPLSPISNKNRHLRKGHGALAIEVPSQDDDGYDDPDPMDSQDGEKSAAHDPLAAIPVPVLENLQRFLLVHVGQKRPGGVSVAGLCTWLSRIPVAKQFGSLEEVVSALVARLVGDGTLVIIAAKEDVEQQQEVLYGMPPATTSQ
ncbi:hypothetical protein BC828DRAFT_373325 [Blastocladiella britannica]|nr:hypothetical protein BC828DRAFT_373325 [Blastocladiella britannica]